MAKIRIAIEIAEYAGKRLIQKYRGVPFPEYRSEALHRARVRILQAHAIFPVKLERGKKDFCPHIALLKAIGRNTLRRFVTSLLSGGVS